MPAKSKAQQRLMQAAEHGADFPMAQKIRGSMSRQQMHDFAVGSEAGKPQHVRQASARRSDKMAHASVHPGKNLGAKFLHPKGGY